MDLWGLTADHPWWTGLFVVGGLSMLLLSEPSRVRPRAEVQRDSPTASWSRPPDHDRAQRLHATGDRLRLASPAHPHGAPGIETTGPRRAPLRRPRYPKHDTVTPAHTQQSQSRELPPIRRWSLLGISPGPYPMGPRRDPLAISSPDRIQGQVPTRVSSAMACTRWPSSRRVMVRRRTRRTYQSSKVADTDRRVRLPWHKWTAGSCCGGGNGKRS